MNVVLQPIHMADFTEVRSIQTIGSEMDSKARVRLSIAGANESLVITTSCLSAADDIADVIDNYCRLVNSGNSCWHHKGIDICCHCPSIKQNVEVIPLLRLAGRNCSLKNS